MVVVEVQQEEEVEEVASPVEVQVPMVGVRGPPVVVVDHMA